MPKISIIASGSTIGVSIEYGWIELTRMPNSPTSSASAFVSRDQAVLGRGSSAPLPGVAFRPADELTMMIEPPLPASIIAGTAARMVRHVPLTVDVDDGVPLLLGHLEHPAPAQHAGVGDHDVEPAELLDAVGDHLLQRGQIADVDLAGEHLPAGRLHGRDRLGEILGGRQRVGDGVARPARRCRWR